MKMKKNYKKDTINGYVYLENITILNIYIYGI